MAELSSAARNRLPDSAFARPDRSYPVQDRSHAANAKARATQQENAGNLSPSEAAHIRARADAVLHEHATTMAAADHLHSRGHIDTEHRDRIHAHVRQQMTRGGDHAKPPPRAPAFGSLSGSGHYMATVEGEG